MHDALLFAHGWLRWAVLLAWCVVLVRGAARARAGAPWDRTDDTVHKVAVGLLDLQVLLGVCLYLGTSPLAEAFFRAPGASMRVGALRFFGLEHPVGMVAGAALLHVGRVLTRRRPTGRRGTAMRWSAAGILVVAASIPWPKGPAPRPLARTAASTPRAAAPACPEAYATRCATCHGPRGRGDGTAAAGLGVRPRDFRDPAWAFDPVRVGRVVREGGPALGLSPAMPAHPDLAELEPWVRCVESLRRAD